MNQAYKYNPFDNFSHSNDQKTMEWEDDIIAILKRFDVVTRQIV